MLVFRASRSSSGGCNRGSSRSSGVTVEKLNGNNGVKLFRTIFQILLRAFPFSSTQRFLPFSGLPFQPDHL